MNIDWRGLEKIDLGTGLLDRQVNGPKQHPVGKVDDLELTERDGRIEVTALILGTAALRERVPRGFRWLLRAGFLFGGGSDQTRRIGFDQIKVVDSDVEVTSQAAESAESETERRLRRFIARIPGAEDESQ
jgi:hypothetical protein